MDVNIHPDPGLAARDAEDEVGALDPDPAERDEFFQVARQFPTVLGGRTRRAISWICGAFAS